MTVAEQLEPELPSLLGTPVHEGELIGPREPWFGPPTTIKFMVILSMSVALRLMMTGVSSLVETVILWAVGASLTLFTVMDAVAILLVTWPSLTLKLKLS